MATFEENEQSQPPSLLPENAASDDLLSVSVPYNNNNNIQLSSLPTMFMNPTFPDTLYDQELETQFGRLNISSNNPTHHHHLSPYYGNFMLNNNGGVGSVLGNNQSLLGFDDYCLRFEELQRMRVLQSDADNGMGYMQQQQQGFFNGAKNLRFLELPRSSNNNYHSIIPRSLNTNNGLQNPYEYFGGVLPSAARNGCTHGQYNVYRNDSRSFVNNGENPSRYLLSSMGVENDRVHQARQRARFSDLKSLRGSIFLVAKDQDGCRFLQKRVEEKKSEEIEMIFREVRVHVRELMVDQFGNFVMQKLFEVCNVQQMNQLLVILVSDLHQLLAICIDSHGTRTMQKFLEYLTTDQQRTCLASTLQHITLDLCKNTNGHHVIRHCLKLFNIREIKQILDVVVLHCIDIATDKSGCCVLQQCVEHAQGEHRARLVDEITKNVLLLSESRYGNYVVQYLLGLKIRRITNDLLSHLKSHFVSLSMNKFGSNVVEKCLKEADGVQADQIILEIISHNKFLMVLQDSYGNYVAQSALERAQGPIRDQMIRAIQNHYPSLHSHPHGKRVFARAKSNINKQRQPNNSFDDMF
ncbi:RNA metabolism protein [Lithospermum erythrorhizon]|uniref:RNA metabolism protein n=1 Tax=Lithospermum erythrorhizon TaxID=34254 RepID=A0AAV3PJZ1_LITER